MPAKDFGTKYLCHKCGTKYYDMRKPDPVCPKCGADQKEAAPAGKTERKSRLSAAPKIIAKVEPVVEEAASEEEDIDAIEPAEVRAAVAEVAREGLAEL